MSLTSMFPPTRLYRPVTQNGRKISSS
jgi:hypothetical protein